MADFDEPDEEARLIEEMTAARDRVKATGSKYYRDYTEAIRDVLHNHGMVMQDEID